MNILDVFENYLIEISEWSDHIKTDMCLVHKRISHHTNTRQEIKLKLLIKCYIQMFSATQTIFVSRQTHRIEIIFKCLYKATAMVWS